MAAPQGMGPKPRRLGRELACWLGSFVIVATLLIFCGAPWAALLVGGGLALAAVLIRHRIVRQSHAP